MCTRIRAFRVAISAFSQVPMSWPIHLIVSSVQRCTGSPWTLIQNRMRDGKEGETVGYQRCKIIIHLAQWQGRCLSTAKRSGSSSNWNWNRPFPRSDPTGLNYVFQCSVKNGISDHTFWTDLFVTRPIRVRACLRSSSELSGSEAFTRAARRGW